MRGEGRKWQQMRDIRRYIKRENMRGEDRGGGEKTKGDAKEKEGGKDSSVGRDEKMKRN